MESADGHCLGRFFGDHPADPLTHFAGGLVGEGYGKDLGRIDPFFEHVGNPAGDSTGLASACTRQQHHWAIEYAHRLALSLI